MASVCLPRRAGLPVCPRSPSGRAPGRSAPGRSPGQPDGVKHADSFRNLQRAGSARDRVPLLGALGHLAERSSEAQGKGQAGLL